MRPLLSITVIGSLLVPHIAFAFTDLPPEHVNAEAIEYVRSHGIVTGYPDDTYKPDSKINRAEFIKIIVQAGQYSIAGSGCFPDVKNEWFAQYVCTAKSAGIVSGYPNGNFMPAENITFVEAAKIISNAFAMSGSTNSDVWYEPFVLALESRNAIPLEVQKLDQPVTRGQIAEMIYRLHANRKDKASQTYATLSQGSSLQENEGDTTLVTLPIPFSHYRFYAEPTLKIDKTGKNHMLVLPVKTDINDDSVTSMKLFVNGEDKGDFKDVVLADFTDRDSQPMYITSDGEKQKSTGLPKFKRVNQEYLANFVARFKSPAFMDEMRTILSQHKSGKELKEELRKQRAILPKKIEEFERAAEEELHRPNIDVTEFLEDGESIVAINRNNTQGEYLFVVSSKVGKAKVMHFKEEAGIPNLELSNIYQIAENVDKTKFLYRSEVSGANFFIVDNGSIGKSYPWTTLPQYNVKNEAMYITFSSLPETNEDIAKLECKAIIGESEKDVACNDQLFWQLINFSFLRFPMTSPDGKTTVYPELVKSGVYKNDDFTVGIESAPKTRLVVNGKAQETHSYIDKPFFTSKGLAVLSYIDKPNSFINQYVEWNGKKSQEFLAIGTGLQKKLGLWGISPLYAAIHSLLSVNLTVEEVAPEVIVSPDGNSIAFAGFMPGEGWVVLKDMNIIGTYQLVDQLTYSPDSKHVAFLAVKRTLDQIFNQNLLPEGNENQSMKAASVIVDGEEIDKHEELSLLQYAPNGKLTYIAKDKNKYTLYIDGKPVGAAFDSILTRPQFKNGMVEVAGVRGEKIVLMKRSLVAN